jgi:hypothetical protein
LVKDGASTVLGFIFLNKGREAVLAAPLKHHGVEHVHWLLERDAYLVRLDARMCQKRRVACRGLEEVNVHAKKGRGADCEWLVCVGVFAHACVSMIEHIARITSQGGAVGVGVPHAHL